MINFEDGFVYCSGIKENNDDTFNVYATGDGLWSSFADLLYDLNEYNIDPTKCHIMYFGTWGYETDEEEHAEWFDSVPEVMNKVIDITFDDMFDEDERNVIEYIINTRNIDRSKIKFAKDLEWID